MSRTCETLHEDEQCECERRTELHEADRAESIRLSANIAQRVHTFATSLAAWSRDVPKAPKTIFGVVASVATGAPEAEFSPDDVIMIAFAAGELNGISFALGVPLPLLLLAAGIKRELAADEEAISNALAMDRMAARDRQRTA